MGRKNNEDSTFTLRDVLVSVALLAVVAFFAMALINPAEQAGRKRDGEYRAQASELNTAIKKYTERHNVYPWVLQEPSLYSGNDSPVGFINAASKNVGICGETCASEGVLISDGMLTPDFRTSSFIIKNTDIAASIYMGKAAGPNGPVYSCYIPLSDSVRKTQCKAGNVFTLDPKTGGRSSVDASLCSSSKNWPIDSPANSWFVCVPD